MYLSSSCSLPKRTNSITILGFLVLMFLFCFSQNAFADKTDTTEAEYDPPKTISATVTATGKNKKAANKAAKSDAKVKEALDAAKEALCKKAPLLKPVPWEYVSASATPAKKPRGGYHKPTHDNPKVTEAYKAKKEIYDKAKKEAKSSGGGLLGGLGGSLGGLGKKVLDKVVDAAGDEIAKPDVEVEITHSLKISKIVCNWLLREAAPVPTATPVEAPPQYNVQPDNIPGFNSYVEYLEGVGSGEYEFDAKLQEEILDELYQQKLNIEAEQNTMQQDGNFFNEGFEEQPNPEAQLELERMQQKGLDPMDPAALELQEQMFPVLPGDEFGDSQY